MPTATKSGTKHSEALMTTVDMESAARMTADVSPWEEQNVGVPANGTCGSSKPTPWATLRRLRRWKPSLYRYLLRALRRQVQDAPADIKTARHQYLTCFIHEPSLPQG